MYTHSSPTLTIKPSTSGLMDIYLRFHSPAGQSPSSNAGFTKTTPSQQATHGGLADGKEIKSRETRREERSGPMRKGRRAAYVAEETRMNCSGRTIYHPNAAAARAKMPERTRPFHSSRGAINKWRKGCAASNSCYVPPLYSNAQMGEILEPRDCCDGQEENSSYSMDELLDDPSPYVFGTPIFANSKAIWPVATSSRSTPEPCWSPVSWPDSSFGSEEQHGREADAMFSQYIDFDHCERK